MKWVLIAVAVVVVALLIIAMVFGGGSGHSLSDADRKRWSARLEGLVDPLEEKRFGAGCKPFVEKCELAGGESAGRIEVRLIKDSKRTLHFEPHGEGVAFDLDLKLGEDPSRLTVPKKGGTLTVAPPCALNTCQLAFGSH